MDQGTGVCKTRSDRKALRDKAVKLLVPRPWWLGSCGPTRTTPAHTTLPP